MFDTRRKKRNLAEQRDAVYPAALRYLARRDYSSRELRARLLQRGADVDAVEETIQRLVDKGYLDDRRFAAGRVRTRRDYSRRGPNAVRAELRELGIAEETILDALAEEYDPDVEQRIVSALVKKEMAEISRLEDKDLCRRRTASLQRRLLARGFQPEVVFEAVRGAAEKPEE